MKRSEALRRLGEARVAVLGTVDVDRAVHMVPVTFVVVAETTVVTAVDEKPKKSRRLRRLANIEADPRVVLLAHHFEEDWSRLWWVRADGLASLEDRVDHAWESELRRKYGLESAELGPWIVIRIGSISGWSAG